MTELAVIKKKELSLDPKEVIRFIDPQGKGSEEEHKFFIELCKARELNPFTKEAYFIKYGTTAAAVVVAVDTFVARANEHNDYEGYKTGWIIGSEDNPVRTDNPFGKCLGAFCEVYRKNKQPTVSVVRLSEYSSGKSRWATAPWQMIEKVSITASHRKAYPKSFQHLYGIEEMDKAKIGSDDNDNDNDNQEESKKIKTKTTKGEKLKSALEDEQVKIIINEFPDAKVEVNENIDFDSVIFALNDAFSTCENRELKSLIFKGLTDEENPEMEEQLHEFAIKYKENQEILSSVAKDNLENWKKALSEKEWESVINYMNYMKGLFTNELKAA
jgi:phage recombination protein Bet